MSLLCGLKETKKWKMSVSDNHTVHTAPTLSESRDVFVQTERRRGLDLVLEPESEEVGVALEFKRQ
jgi:hypothetical protein